LFQSKNVKEKEEEERKERKEGKLLTTEPSFFETPTGQSFPSMHHIYRKHVSYSNLTPPHYQIGVERRYRFAFRERTDSKPSTTLSSFMSCVYL
jgi:hypothetical protein